MKHAEHAIQCEFFKAASFLRCPGGRVIDYLAAIPNGAFLGAGTDKITQYRRGARLRAEGLRAGFPDMIFCQPSGTRRFYALFLEFKAGAGGRVSPEQRAWHERLEDNGYAVYVVRGAAEAVEMLQRYLTL